MKKRKQKFSLRRKYLESFKFIKESLNYILSVFALFVLFFAMGFILPYVAEPSVLDQIMKIVEEWVKEILEQTEGLGFFGMWEFILFNNGLVALLSIFSGFLLGIIPALLLFSNGLVIGIISAIAFSVEGSSSFLKLLPHGIFEIPAIIISLAIGIKNASFLFAKNPRKRFAYLMKNSFWTFLLVVLPLLIIASLIEAFLIVSLG